MKVTEKNKEAMRMLDFIQKSPSPFHAVANIEKELEAKGFIRLQENKKWQLALGGKFFVTRNSSAIIAFTLPKSGVESFNICASHCDSPSFKIKENPVLSSASCLKLNVEPYGGMLCAPWFDRPLSFAGRVIYKDAKSNSPDESDETIRLKQKLIDVDRDLLMIPSLAIHMNREANSGYTYNAARDMVPLLAFQEDKNQDSNLIFKKLIASYADIEESALVSADLFLYCRSQPTFWGLDNEFISSAKLDDLECVWTSLEAFLSSDAKVTSVFAVFDNEEVGSRTRQGAESTFLADTLERISLALNLSEEEHKICLSKSFMVSADNAHAVHPNYEGESDPVNKPLVNKGPVIKFNAEQRYTSDSLSAAVFKEVCKKAGVPFQIFTNRSDKRGGSTLGNISGTKVSIASVDIGLAQWAMHSPYESAGALDLELMVRALKEFYSSRLDF